MGPTTVWEEKVEQQLRDAIRLREELLRSHVAAIVEIGRRMAACLERGGKVLLCGNGGSAADCQHIATELVGRLRAERPGLAAIALTTDTSALTAIGNDYGFEHVFARQVEALARGGDLLLAISTSGDSPNVLAAVAMARAHGVETIGLTGARGGRLRGAADFCLCVPSDDTQRVQEAHITVGHLACEIAEQAISPGRRA